MIKDDSLVLSPHNSHSLWVAFDVQKSNSGTKSLRHICPKCQLIPAEYICMWKPLICRIWKHLVQGHSYFSQITVFCIVYPNCYKFLKSSSNCPKTVCTFLWVSSYSNSTHYQDIDLTSCLTIDTPCLKAHHLNNLESIIWPVAE